MKPAVYYNKKTVEIVGTGHLYEWTSMPFEEMSDYRLKIELLTHKH